MAFRSVVGLLGGAGYLFFATLSHAECTKDTDCKGERICEAGVCTSPAPASTPPADAAAPAPVPAAAAEPAPTPVATAPAVASPRVIRVEDASLARDSSYSVTESDSRRNKRNWKRHSTGMMAGGIVMTSLSSVAFLVSLAGSIASSSCDRTSYGYGGSGSVSVSYEQDCNFDTAIYGGLVTGVVLVGVGIPLIVIGAKREPIGTVSAAPWGTPHAGGLSLRLSL